MHGRKREAPGAPLSAADESRRAAKLAKFRAAVAAVRALRASGGADADLLAATAALLASTPDYYSLWGYRREVLLRLFETAAAGSPERTDLANAELALTEAVLSDKNPKVIVALILPWRRRDLAGRAC